MRREQSQLHRAPLFDNPIVAQYASISLDTVGNSVY
jgi:hypothetical protein